MNRNLFILLGCLFVVMTGYGISLSVLPVSAAFVADLTIESQREKGMAWMGSAVGIGVMIGPDLGGMLAEVFSNSALFFLMGISLILLMIPRTMTFVLLPAQKLLFLIKMSSEGGQGHGSESPAESEAEQGHH